MLSLYSPAIDEPISTYIDLKMSLERRYPPSRYSQSLPAPIHANEITLTRKKRGRSMKIHEYQAKELFRKNGVAVPDGAVAFTVEEAKAVAD
jgi:hypothetical protein